MRVFEWSMTPLYEAFAGWIKVDAQMAKATAAARNFIAKSIGSEVVK